MDNQYSHWTPEPFVEALVRGEQRVALGSDPAGNLVVLFGVDATAYPMQNGSMSTGLVAAVPLEYITDFLSLEDEGSWCIIILSGRMVVL